MKKLVVTRHPALLELLLERGLIKKGDYELITHATPEDIKGKDVIGVLPMALAALTNTITEVPLMVPQELRGQELSLDQVRKFAGTPVTYKVLSLS